MSEFEAIIAGSSVVATLAAASGHGLAIWQTVVTRRAAIGAAQRAQAAAEEASAHAREAAVAVAVVADQTNGMLQEIVHVAGVIEGRNGGSA